MRPGVFWWLVVVGAVVFALAALTGCGPATPASTTTARSPLFNPVVTQATIGQTICVKGWTAKVRPPLAFTAPIKRQLIAQLPATASHNPADYELDHWVPLEVGGAPANPVNLVLQPIGPALIKDKLENETHDQVCAGKLTLAAGRAVFTKMPRP